MSKHQNVRAHAVVKLHILPHTTAHLVQQPVCSGFHGEWRSHHGRRTESHMDFFFFRSGRQSPEFKSSRDACAPSRERTNLQMCVMEH